MSLRKPGLDRVTGISVLVWTLVLIVVCAVLFAPKDAYTPDQRTMVIQGVLFALGALTGYWLGSTEADQKKHPMPDPPTTVTTITTTDEPKPEVKP